MIDVLKKIEYALRKDSLTVDERIASARTIVCAAISKAEYGAPAQSGPIERVRAGLQAIVDLKNPMPRAAVREAVAELLATLDAPAQPPLQTALDQVRDAIEVYGLRLVCDEGGMFDVEVIDISSSPTLPSQTPLSACTQAELDAFAGLDSKSQQLFLMWADRALKAEAALSVAQRAPKTEDLWECSGCGTRKSIEQIKAEHPNALSCCPERKMGPAVTSTPAQRAPMRNDIAQMISDGWKSGKSSIDVAEEILREFDTSAVTSTACTWPDCDQPSGHDFCHRHCLDNAGHPAHSSTHRCPEDK